MDYGKLAYRKAEELEARLVPPRQTGAVSAGFTSDAPAQGLKLTGCRLKGSAVILVKVQLVCKEAATAVVTLRLDGLAVADAEVRLVPDMPQTELLMGCVEKSGEASLTLDCDDKRVLVKRVELGLVGDAAAFTRETSDFRFARKGAAGMAALAGSNVVTAYPVDRGVGEGREICRGNSFDLCAVPDGYALLNCDPAGNLWLRTLDETLETVSIRRLGDALDSPTLGYWHDRLTVAGVENGKAVTFAAAENALRYPVEFAAKVDGVYFVKDAPAPILAIASGGKVYLKTACDRALGGENVSVTGSIYAKSDWGDEYQWA